MWIFAKDGFFSLAQHPKDADKLVIQMQSREELEPIVLLLDELNGETHEIEQVSDGFCRFAVAANRDMAVPLVARLISEIDYTVFTQAARFDFGADPQFLIWINNGSLQVGRVKPACGGGAVTAVCSVGPRMLSE
jgi:hypothetical protein